MQILRKPIILLVYSKEDILSLTGTNDKGKKSPLSFLNLVKSKSIGSNKGLTENEAKQTIAAAHPEIQIEKLL